MIESAYNPLAFPLFRVYLVEILQRPHWNEESDNCYGPGRKAL